MTIHTLTSKTSLRWLIVTTILGLLASSPALGCFAGHTSTTATTCAVVLADGVEVRNAADATETLNYLEPVIVIQTAAPQAEIERQNGFVGVVADISLLKIYERQGQGFQAKQIRVTDVVDENDPLYHNPLEAKVVVANTPQRIRRIEHNEEQPNVISMRNRPNASGTEIGKLDIFSILTVHQQHITRMGARWYFVGQSGNDLNDHRKILMGWVQEQDVVLWPQRQAVYPNPRSNGKIYGDNDPGLNAAPIMRLNIKDDAAPDRDFAIGKLPIVSGRDAAAGPFKVVVAAERTGALPGSSTDDKRQLFWQLLANIKQRDILFVIDNTKSMTRYRQPVIDGILEFIDRAGDHDNTRFAFAFYGDRFNTERTGLAWGREYAHWSPEIEMRMREHGGFFQFDLLDFQTDGILPSVAALDEFFGASYYRNDPQRDAPESGLLALNTAIWTASWRQSNSVRVVVYIGDDQDRDRAAHLANAVRALTTHNIILIALNVIGESDDNYNQQWVEDVQHIRTAVEEARNAPDATTKALVYPPIIAYNQGAEEELSATSNVVRDDLLALFIIGAGFGTLDPRDFVGSSDAVQKTIQTINSRLAALNLPSGTFLQEFLAAQRLGSAVDLAQFYATNDTVLTGYLPRDNTQLYVAMTPIEHNAIMNAMHTVCKNMYRSDTIERDFRNTAREIAAVFLGEEMPGDHFVQSNEKISDFFRRILWLPAEYFSIFGDRTVTQFIAYVRDQANAPTETYSNIQKEVCLSAKLLETIAGGEYATRDMFRFTRYDPRLGRPIFEATAPLKKFDWVWGPRSENAEGHLGLYFVPQEFFPRDVTQ